jgi:hypothetical protein
MNTFTTLQFCLSMYCLLAVVPLQADLAGCGAARRMPREEQESFMVAQPAGYDVGMTQQPYGAAAPGAQPYGTAPVGAQTPAAYPPTSASLY